MAKEVQNKKTSKCGYCGRVYITRPEGICFSCDCISEVVRAVGFAIVHEGKYATGSLVYWGRKFDRILKIKNG